MLVINRRTNERIVIGEGADRVVIQVVRVGERQVVLGITGPPHVRIDRMEVRDRIDREEGEKRG